MSQQRAISSRNGNYRPDTLDSVVMLIVRPILAINFLHGILAYTILSTSLPLATPALIIFVVNSLISGSSYMGISRDIPLLLVPGIFAKIASIVALPLLVLPIALDVSAENDKSVDELMLGWLGFAVICFVVEEHLMCFCFVYQFRMRRNQEEKLSDESPPPKYSVAVRECSEYFQPQLYACPQYSAEDAPSCSSSWPSAVNV